MNHVNCPYCGNPAKLVTGADLYPHRPDLASKYFWQCKPCEAHVGCHSERAYFFVNGKKKVSDGTLPLGRLANAELRQAKSAAHAIFDPLWKHTEFPKTARTAAYAWLAAELGIPVHECHIGEFDLERCNHVTSLCLARFRNSRG